MNQGQRNVKAYFYFLGFVVIFIAFTVTSIYSYLQYSHIRTELIHVTKNNDNQLSAAMDMRVAVRERAILLWRMALQDDYFERDETLQAFYEHGSNYHKSRMLILTSHMDPDEAYLMTTLDKETNKRAPILRDFANKLLEKKDNKDHTQSLNQVLTNQIVVANLLDSMIALQQSQNEYSRYHSAEEMANLLSKMILLMIIIITGGFMFATYVIMTTTKQSQLLEKMNDELEHLACHDHLTGLPNRMLLLQQLERLLSTVHRKKIQAALMFIDIDNFKEINDTFGHDFGDHCLKDLTQNMLKIIRGADILGRLGGDEFLILINEIESSNQMIVIAHKLLESLNTHYTLADKTVTISASIGIYMLSDETTGAKDAIDLADKAMYQAKKSGKNRFVIV
jgi:diguanylate cyclase (GGDEF)-like protein